MSSNRRLRPIVRGNRNLTHIVVVAEESRFRPGPRRPRACASAAAGAVRHRHRSAWRSAGGMAGVVERRAGANRLYRSRVARGCTRMSCHAHEMKRRVRPSPTNGTCLRPRARAAGSRPRSARDGRRTRARPPRSIVGFASARHRRACCRRDSCQRRQSFSPLAARMFRSARCAIGAPQSVATDHPDIWPIRCKAAARSPFGRGQRSALWPVSFRISANSTLPNCARSPRARRCTLVATAGRFMSPARRRHRSWRCSAQRWRNGRCRGATRNGLRKPLTRARSSAGHAGSGNARREISVV